MVRAEGALLAGKTEVFLCFYFLGTTFQQLTLDKQNEQRGEFRDTQREQLQAALLICSIFERPLPPACCRGRKPKVAIRLSRRGICWFHRRPME